jgi:hypothetical protein
MTNYQHFIVVVVVVVLVVVQERIDRSNEEY